MCVIINTSTTVKSTCHLFYNACLILIRLYKSRKYNTISLLIYRGSLAGFMRNRIVHLQSPSAPTQPTHTHLSHAAHCTNSNCTCIFTQEKHNPYFYLQISLESLIPSPIHAHTRVDELCHQQQRQDNKYLVRSGFAMLEWKGFLLGLTFLLRLNLINILYGFYMDLFFLFSYSVPEVPWPRSSVSLMIVGEQSILCTPPNIAQHALHAVEWILIVREKTCFQKQEPENHVSQDVWVSF